ncbi:MAG: LPS assembly lipoprotein LptE [Bilophila wadsworthia]
MEQTSLYPWLTYQVRSLVRDDINARNLAKWVDDGQADYTLTVRIPSFKVRSYGQYRSASQLYTATISIEFIVYDGKTNTEVWRSGSIFYEENYENANEESAIKSIPEMAVPLHGRLAATFRPDGTRPSLSPMTTRPGFSFCICPDGKLLRQQVEEFGAHPDAGRERHFLGRRRTAAQILGDPHAPGAFSTSRVLVMRNAHALTADV